MRHRARCAVAAVIFGIVLLSPAAGAQEGGSQQRDELGLSVSVGFDGRSREATWQPVSVGLEPVRPVAGTLSVTGRDSATTELLQIEVAAGSRKVYRFVVPSGRIEVTFVEDGAEPLTVRPATDPVTGEYLVGLLGPAPDTLPPLRSEQTGRSGAWVVVDPAWLDVAAQSLEPLGTIVAGAGDLQALPPPAAANLAAAVAGGLDMVVVGGDSSDAAALGLELGEQTRPWQVTFADLTDGACTACRKPLATAFTAGAGRVVTTAIAPGDGQLGRSSAFWSLLAQPSGRPEFLHGDYRVTSTPHQFARVLAETDGNTPTLPGLGAFVLVYVLVVGPVNGVVLARLGRRELAWATVPMVTVIFTIGAFVGATTARPESGGTTRLTYWVDGAATEVVAAGVRSPTPGTRSVTLPGAAWTVRPLVDGGNNVNSTVRRGEDVTVAMDLTALQLGGVAAWRTVTAPAPLEVAARTSRDGVNVTIRNTSGAALSDVVARTATSQRSLGRLPAGGKTSVDFATTRLSRGSAFTDPFEGLRLDRNGGVAAPLSMRAVLNTEVVQGRPGTVWVSGVAPGPGVEATTGGDPLRDRGSMVAVGTAIQGGSGGLSPFAVARDVLLDVQATQPVGPTAVEGDGEVFLRFRLPAGTDAGELRNDLENSGQTGGNPQLTVWDHGARQWVGLDEGFGASRGRLIGPLGEVWVRASGQMFPFEYAGRSVAGEVP